MNESAEDMEAHVKNTEMLLQVSCNSTRSISSVDSFTGGNAEAPVTENTEMLLQVSCLSE